jgi:hypothetical protein
MITVQPIQKFHETSISTNKKVGMVAFAHHPSYAETVNRRLMVQASLGIKQDCILKIARTEKGEAMAQVIEHLASKHRP